MAKTTTWRTNSNLKSTDKIFLALNSCCSEQFGVAICTSNSTISEIKQKIFTNGKNLSNEIFNYIEYILPQNYWPYLTRICVSIGPGTYTGTRLSLAIARLLAQQLNISLDGFSSFNIMAYRCLDELISNEKYVFEIMSEDKRRGYLVGRYRLKRSNNNYFKYEIIEESPPKLFKKFIPSIFSIKASTNLQKDLITQIRLCQINHNNNIIRKWNNIIPIYPSSPVD